MNSVKEISVLMEYLKTPQNAATVICCIFIVCQIVGELLEFKGKIVPEIMKIRKYFSRKKREREVLAMMPALIDKLNSAPDLTKTLNDATKILKEFDAHYSNDNITMRDVWMEEVNKRLESSDKWMQRLNEKMDKNHADTLDIMIDNMRNAIIDFAAYVANENNPVTREQYTRIFKVHKKYEATIEEHGITNGEVDVAYRIITESYEHHMKHNTFVENIRGYDI